MLIPGPDTRVVELRVHGVQGTTPQSLVDAVAAVDVAGDGIGRIVRPADRLRRPAPGPVLQADGRPIPRTVEGYVWGGMTSGGWAKATWALLFPFCMANVAHWMLPPVPGNLPAHVIGLALRSLLRVFALLLTVLLVAQVAVISMDLVAAQCLAAGSPCLDSASTNVRSVPWLRTIIAFLPVVLMIAVLRRVSHVDWRIERRELAMAEEEEERKPSGLPGAHVATDPDTPALRSLHIVASLATTALIALGGPLRQLVLPPGWAGVALVTAWWVSLVLIGLSFLCVLLLDDPTGGAPDRGGRWLRTALQRRGRHALLALSALLVVATIALLPQLPDRVHGADTVVQILAVLMAFVALLFGLLLVPAALLARGTWSSLPRELRPWAGGWMAAPVLAVAGLLGGGFGAGVALTVRRLLGSGLVLPRGYDYITLLWGFGGAVGLLCGLVAGSMTGAVRWRAFRKGKLWAREASLLHAGRPRDLRKATKALWWARWERHHGHHMILIVCFALAIGTVPAAWLRVRGIEPDPLFSALGVAVLAVLAIWLLRAVYLAAKQPESGRRLGVMADIASFWPREAHPIVPPCYALKVVPELVSRVRDHLRDPGTRVVLCGHSQGSLLAAVAAARLLEELPEPDRERIGLVTAGSQLQWAYPRAFPAVVPHSSLAQLSGGLAGRWRALCRGTDPLGGPVMTWRRQVFDGMLLGVGYRSDGTEGALAPALRGPTGALVLGGDHWLPDPQRGPFPGRRWASGVLAHSDYTSDPEWDRAVAIAAGLGTVEGVEAPSLPAQMRGK